MALWDDLGSSYAAPDLPPAGLMGDAVSWLFNNSAWNQMAAADQRDAALSPDALRQQLLNQPGDSPMLGVLGTGNIGEGAPFLGGGLAAPPGLPDRIRRLVGRDPDAGAPKNAALELEPGVFVGNGTHDQWLARTEHVLTPDEIAEARKWYRDASGAYNQHFGPELGPDMMGAWLTGNVNASPSFAQLSALRTREQLINQTGLIGEQKQGGLADEALRSYWQARGVGPDAGPAGTLGGQKIYDFIDSANGSPTRAFYGHDPAAGAPFVADVHSLRDMGMVDDPTLKWVAQNYGPEKAAALKRDAIGGGPSETQYEWTANKGRDLTDWLNQRGYMGGGWIPSEVQAVGWKAMSKMLGRAGETPEQAIIANRRPMSYELDPGQGSPFESWFKQLGWHDLSPEAQGDVTRNVMGRILDFAKEQTGGIEGSRLSDAQGGWNAGGQATLAPAGRSYIISSPEVFGDMADIVGYLANQTKVMGMRMMNSGNRLGVAIHHPDLADPAVVKDMWQGLVENHPDFAAGFSPAQHPDGTPGMELLFDKGGVGMSNRIQSELIPGIQSIGERLGLSDDLRVSGFKAEELSREHDWTQDPTATTGYLGRLYGRYGPALQQRMEDFKAQTLHPLIEHEISSRRPQAAAPPGIAAPPGLLNPE